MNNTCLYCNEIIPEGGQVCPTCDHKLMKIGMILQSNNATEEEVEEVYKDLEVVMCKEQHNEKNI